NIGNNLRSTPSLASIGGAEGANTEAFKGHHHGAVGLHQRLATQTSGVIGGGFADTPGLAAITGGAHQHPARAQCRVPFGVAIAVKGTGWRVVAHGPVLVVEVGSINQNRIAPVNTVRGKTDRYITDGTNQWKGGDHPHPWLAMVATEGSAAP